MFRYVHVKVTLNNKFEAKNHVLRTKALNSSFKLESVLETKENNKDVKINFMSKDNHFVCH